MSSTYEFSPGLFLDIELPSTAQDGSTRPPVIVWIHNGGWRLHDRTARPNCARAFTPQGFAMVSIYYRLAPAGTIHSFSFHAHNTHMLGMLTTPLFEKILRVYERALGFHRARTRHRAVVPGGRMWQGARRARPHRRQPAATALAGIRGSSHAAWDEPTTACASRVG